MNKVATAIVAFVAAIPLTLSGCSLLHKPAPDVTGQTITRKRLGAMEEIEAALAVVDAGARFTSYAIATDDRCDKGENDAFTRDGYAYRCTVRMTHFYGTSDNFRTSMLGFEDLLVSRGWRLPRSPFRETFASYYDRYCAGRRIAIFGSDRDAAPECDVSKLHPSGSDEYKMGELILWIVCGQRGGDTLYVRDMMEIMQRVPVTLRKEGDPKFDLYKQQSLQNVNALIDDITASHEYVLSVTIQRTYFEN